MRRIPVYSGNDLRIECASLEDHTKLLISRLKEHRDKVGETEFLCPHSSAESKESNNWFLVSFWPQSCFACHVIESHLANFSASRSRNLRVARRKAKGKATI